MVCFPTQSWDQKTGETCLLVPGQLLAAPIPNFIILNTKSGESSWHAASEIWVPEYSLHNHLVLKLEKN